MKTQFFQSLFRLGLVCTAFFSILPSVFPDNWFIDNLSHFKVQYIVILLVLLLMSLLLKTRKFDFFIIVALILWNSFFIAPLYASAQPEKSTTEAAEEFSILSINLLASNTHFEKVVSLISKEDPEIVVLLELSPVWQEQLEEIYPHYSYRSLLPRQDNFGIGILSKIPMESSVVRFGSPKPSLLTRLEFKSEMVTLLATHPVPPVSGESFRSRNQQMQVIAREREKFSENFILIGDLNMSSFSRHFRELKESANLRDTRKGFGICPSWPADFFPLQTTLDHCLFGGNLQVLDRNTEMDIGSDHLPISVKFKLN